MFLRWPRDSYVGILLLMLFCCRFRWKPENGKVIMFTAKAAGMYLSLGLCHVGCARMAGHQTNKNRSFLRVSGEGIARDVFFLPRDSSPPLPLSLFLFLFAFAFVCAIFLHNQLHSRHTQHQRGLFQNGDRLVFKINDYLPCNSSTMRDLLRVKGVR